MLEKYKWVIFDLDDTLVETHHSHRYWAVSEALRRLGKIDRYSEEFADRFWLEGNRDAFLKEAFGCNPIDFWRILSERDFIEERIKQTTAHDDAIETLREVNKLGKKIAIITDAPSFLAEREVDLLPRELLSHIISLTTAGYPEKPNPVSFPYCLQLLNAHYREVVYIGNSRSDEKYALGAGVDFILVDRMIGGTDHPLLESLNSRRINSLRKLCTPKIQIS